MQPNLGGQRVVAANLVARNSHRSRSSLIHHCERPQEGTANQRFVSLPALLKRHACEYAVDCESQRGNVHLRQMHIYVTASVNSGDGSAIHNWQVKLRRQ